MKAETPNLIPPQDLEAEMSLLGAMFLENGVIPLAAEMVASKDFYLSGNAILFDAMVDMHGRKEAADLVTLPAELRKIGKLEEIGGLKMVASLMRAVPSPANFEHYAKSVKAAAVFRELVAFGETIKAMGYKAGRRSPAEVLDMAQKRLSNINVGLSERHGRSVSESASWFREHIRDIRENNTGITGLKTGFHQLDNMIGGWQKQRLYVIAGVTSIGKSAGAMGFIDVAARQRVGTVAIFSLEMSEAEVWSRLVAPGCQLSAKTFETAGGWSEWEYEHAQESIDDIEKLPIHIDEDRDLSVIQIRQRARAIHRKTSLSMIVVDHLHLIRPEDPRQQRRDQIREMVTHLRQTSQILDVPVMLLCQLSRKPGEREDKRPMLGDLYESGSIEQAADMVGFVHRPQYHEKLRLMEAHEDVNADSFEADAEFIVAKQRSGRRGAIKIGFYPGLSHFVELDTTHEEAGSKYERSIAGSQSPVKSRSCPDD